MPNKTDLILSCTKKVKEILDIIRPDNKWIIRYGKLADIELPDWKSKYLQLVDGEDYFFIEIDGDIIYAINVTGDSVLTAIHELVAKLSAKF